MTILTVKNFSCIETATLDLAPLTVVIGPQASGKSVLTKLINFCSSFMPRAASFGGGISLLEVISQAEERFLRMFPASAWGSKPFEIQLQAGPFIVSVNSVKSRSRTGFKIELSGFAQDHLSTLYHDLQKATASVPEADSNDFMKRFQVEWAVRDAAANQLRDALKEDYVGWQLFIPAGRSFFTSNVRSAYAHEKALSIDAMTADFGILFAGLRDQLASTDMKRNTEFAKVLSSPATAEMLGGKVEVTPEGPQIVTPDGRTIPLPYLSSGQQELFPLIATVALYGSSSRGSVTYIEEPEAHLFPTAQSKVVEYLIKELMPPRGRHQRRLVMTTHSPYILAKINNLMKAGSVGVRSSRLHSQVSKIVPEELWLRPGAVAPYAIENGHVISLLDEGLVNAAYLDSASELISDQFLELLDVEYAQ